MSSVSTGKQDSANPTYIYVGAFVDELQRAGVRNIVICPGSRSTPLAMAFAAQACMRTWMHVDERAAALSILRCRTRQHLNQFMVTPCPQSHSVISLPGRVDQTMLPMSKCARCHWLPPQLRLLTT